MGTNIIIDAFLVVVVGGIGQLKGTRDRGLRARHPAVDGRVLDHASASPRSSSSSPSSPSCSGGRRACSRCGRGASHDATASPRTRSRVERQRLQAGAASRLRSSARSCCSASPRWCCPTSGSTCSPKYLCFAHRRDRHRPGLGPRRPARRSARACSSASAATRWRCTSSSPTPARATCPTSCSCTAASTELPRWWRPFAQPAVRCWPPSCCRWSWRCLLGLLIFRRRVRGAYFAILQPGARRRDGHLAGRPAGHHRRHQRPHRLPGLLRLRPRRPGQPADGLLHHRRLPARCCWRSPASSCRAGTASCSSPCGTPRSASASSATTRPTSSSSRTSSRPAWRAWPARCSCRPSGIISPALIGIVPSIEFVIGVAVGGRATLLGPVLGAVAVAWAQTTLSERVPERLDLPPGRCCSSSRSASCPAAWPRSAA